MAKKKTKKISIAALLGKPESLLDIELSNGHTCSVIPPEYLKEGDYIRFMEARVELMALAQDYSEPVEVAVEGGEPIVQYITTTDPVRRLEMESKMLTPTRNYLEALMGVEADTVEELKVPAVLIELYNEIEQALAAYVVAKNGGQVPDDTEQSAEGNVPQETN